MAVTLIIGNHRATKRTFQGGHWWVSIVPKILLKSNPCLFVM